MAQEFENYPKLASQIQWFANYVKVPGSRWNSLLSEINKALSSTIQQQGMVWVKCTEKLPLHRAHWNTKKYGAKDNRFPIRMNGEYHMADIYDQALIGEPKKISIQFDGVDHFQEEFENIEWLDEIK